MQRQRSRRPEQDHSVSGGSRSDELDRAGQVGRAAKADVPRDQREVQQDRKSDVERVVAAQVMPPRPRQLPQRPEVGIAVVDEHPCGPQGEESLLGAEAGVSFMTCLLYTSDAADEEDSVDLGGRRIIKKK